MAFLVIVFIAVALGVLLMLMNRLEKIEREVAELRRRVASEASAPEPSRVAARPPAPAPPPLPRPILHDAVAPEPAPIPVVPPPKVPTPWPAPWGTFSPTEPAPAAHAVPPEHSPERSFEQLIGGIWLQNAGAVLLLLGVFFLILWGYTTGRFGAGVLVAAGVMLGLVLAWRGDSLSKRVPAFGHALIGVGLGAAYISLYLGHFALAVLNPTATIVLLALTSMAGLFVGRHYRVPSISALGVFGAFIPQVAAVLTASPGFLESPPLLFLYLAAVDVVVFALAARSGWSGLALQALVLTDFTWVFAVGSRPWGWPITLGLAGLFVGLGLAPVPRLVREDKPLGSFDAGVILFAPYAFVIAAWPFLAHAERYTVGLLLLVLAAIEAGAATFVHRKRGECDLSRILTTAAVVFLTAGIERLLGSTLTPLGWTVEGIALVAAGVYAASLWMRTLGYGASVLGALAGFLPLMAQGSHEAALPLDAGLPGSLFTAVSIRSLVLVLGLFVGARILERERARLGPDEGRVLPGAWMLAAQFFLLCWLGAHASRLTGIYLPGSGIPGLPSIGNLEAPPDPRRAVLWFSIAALAWSLQAGLSLAHGIVRRSPPRRMAAYGVAILAGVVFLGALGSSSAWKPWEGVFFHLAGQFQVATLLAWALGSTLLERGRARLDAWERGIPAAFPIAANLLFWMWIGVEAGHFSELLAPLVGGHAGTLTLSVIALAWALHALALVAFGQRPQQGSKRILGYGIALAAAFAIFASYGAGLLAPPEVLARGSLFDVRLEFQLAALLIGLFGATMLARSRAALAPREREAPEVLTFVVNALFLLWSAAASQHVTAAYGFARAERVSAVLTSAAWVVQALLLFLVGWRSRASFVRWMGLGLFGLTLAKVALFDLASVDVFWRFLIAIGLGAVMLGISYVYQRSRVGGKEGE